VLPAASFAEKDGTFTNMEGRAQKIKAAINPIGESRPDWQIFSALSEKMGYPMDYDNADAILKEIAQVVEGCRAEEEKDAIGDYVKISLKDLKSMYERKEEKAPTKFPFKLMLGPILFHSGKLSGYSEGPVRILPEGRLKINPNDADKLGIMEGDRALLKNANGEVKVKVEITDRIPEGLLFYPEHFMFPAVRNLCEIDIDKDTKANYFKTANVAVERHVPEH
jgi:formate dehydrogenase alpha subunit